MPQLMKAAGTTPEGTRTEQEASRFVRAMFGRAAGRRLIGSDFCHPMLTGAQRKLQHGRLHSDLVESDALALPFRDASLDLITISFGYRNLANYRAGLVEMRRVLRPGGALAILEFSQPPNRNFATLFNWYSRHVLPVIRGAISGAPRADKYPPESVRQLPDSPGLAPLVGQ